MELSRVGTREALRARPGNAPHWQRLRAGCFLGYRPIKSAGAGTWIARAYDEDAGKYRVKAIGDFGALAPHERFVAARRAAEEFAEEIETGGFKREKLETVKDACVAYAKERPDAEGRFRRFVYGDPLAKMKLDRLRRHHLKEWRERLEECPALVSRNKVGTKRVRDRSPAAVNRDMVPLRAALRKVLQLGKPGTEAAWQEALLPIKNAGTQRTLFLELTQRRSLLNYIVDEAEPFVAALCLLPLRPGAMAALCAGDFDKRTRELTIGKDKSGKPRRILVPEGVAALMTKALANKLPAAPLFARAGGGRWTKEYWNQPIAAAAAQAGLPVGITTYTLRHSVITDLVNGGLAILTVAQISGTSVAMIERHYGHLAQKDAEDALARLAL